MRKILLGLASVAGLAAVATAQPYDLSPYVRFVVPGPERLTIEPPLFVGLGTIEPLPPGRLTIEYAR
jgi:hypothetical protein